MPKTRKNSGLVQAGQVELWLPGMTETSPTPDSQRKTTLKKAAKNRPPKESFLDAVEAIRFEPPAPEDKTFLARELVHCGLPHRDPGNEVAMWTRRTGNLTLTISRTDPDVGFPWGSHPRLFLYWLNTQLLRIEGRRLELGPFFSDFIRALGLHPNGGGKRSDFRRLHNQMERTLAATISFKRVIEQDGLTGKARLNMPVASQSMLWWDYKRPEQGTVMSSFIVVGEEFAQALRDAPIPHDLRAIRALKQSPLALDLYGIMAYRSFVAMTTGKDQTLTWQQLMQQSGAAYDTIQNFRQFALVQLKKILQVFPTLKLQDIPGGVVVAKISRPPVDSRTARRFVGNPSD
jgi:hypothetical protein